MPKGVSALLVIAGLGAAAAVYGGVSGSETFFGIGLPVGFMALIFAPVFYLRANKRRRLFSRQDAVLIWDYAPSEAEGIAAAEAEKTRKTSVRLSILFSVCLAILFAPFILIAEAAETRLPLLIIGLAAVLLPFLSIWLAPAHTRALIRRAPSMTIIGQDYILVTNRYLGINDRADLTLRSAGVTTREDGRELLILIYTFRMKYGGPIKFTVEVPIPRGRMEEARRFAGSRAASHE